MSKRLPGVNIQFPISQLILEGKKTVETRTYPVPDKYLNQEMWIVETPGKSKDFKARVVAKVVFTKSFRYESRKQFYLDQKRHCVTPDSPWAWSDSPKWGWEIKVLKILRDPMAIKQRVGIRFTKEVEV